MKATRISRCIFALACVWICSVALQAAPSKSYLYDTKQENGKIVSKVIFVQENGLLNKQIKYEFSYNEAGKVAEKKAYRWNGTTEEWEPFYLISYEYDGQDAIRSQYGMWDKKKKDFSLNAQQILIPVSGYDEIFS